jgi:hypothetical protein
VFLTINTLHEAVSSAGGRSHRGLRLGRQRYELHDPRGGLDNINNIINNWLNLGTNFLVNLEYTLKYYIVKISEVVAIIMAMVGAFLYFTRLSRYTGRGLLIGAVLLYLFAEVLKSI